MGGRNVKESGKTRYFIMFFCLVAVIIVSVLVFRKIKFGESTAQSSAWLQNAQLDAEETPNELYAKALKEDTLNVLSESTRVMNVKKSFEKQYPGLVVNVQDIRGSDIMNALIENEASGGGYICDLIICSDNESSLSQKLLKEGLIYKYVPYDIADKINDFDNKELLNFIGETMVIIYNNKLNSESPITSWWQLTENEYYGRVVMPNILKSSSAKGLISMIYSKDELMAKTYESHYGVSYSEEENGLSAGKYFIKMLVKNGIVLTNSGDEVLEEVHDSRVDNGFVGMTISSKVRMSDIGYNVAIADNVEGFLGTYSPNSISMVNNAKNVNSAKLFTRWILGESDGKGEGYDVYQTAGVWPVRKDVINPKQPPLDINDYIIMEPEYIYEHKTEIESFWLSLIGESSK